jgi:PAS domain S-box-containing protein
VTIQGFPASLSSVAACGPSDSEFRQMMDCLPAAVYTTDAEGRLTYFNPAAVRLSGRVPHLGTDKWCVTWKIFSPDGTPLPHDRCPMALALQGDEVPLGQECIAERPDGSRFWFTPCPAALRDSAGRVTGGINLLLDISERKSAELHAGDQFRAIVETTPECVKIVAADGTLLFMNSPGLAMIGADSSSAVIGSDVYSLIAPEDRDRYRQFNEKICRGEKGMLEFDIVGLQGVRCHMETHAASLRQADGELVQVAITRNVTESRRIQQAALLLSAIVDSSDDAIISKDLSGVITSWNKSAERMFGYTAAETVGQPVTMLIPTDRLNEEPNILSRLRRGERVDHFETIRRRKDGSLLDISLTISPVKDARGIIIGASKIARDITESKRVYAALLDSEARFRQLADSMPQIVWTSDPAGHIDYYNERWYQFTGYSPESLSETDPDRLFHPDDVEGWRENWSQAVRSANPYQDEYRLFDRREQRWRWFMGRALPVSGANGNIVKWFGSYTDIDDQKRVEDELRRANEDLGQFAFSASHDLQEPLRSVSIYSELLARRYADRLDGEALQFVRFLRNGASRMEMLVRDLLAYTQLSRFEPAGVLASAAEAFEIAVSNLAGAISQTGARITAGALPALPVHASHLQQLFQNIVGNAIKYRSPDRLPAVHVTAESRNGRWMFAVRDNGIGIDPQYKENIFGLFKRLHTDDEYSGTGIGLAICQRIVDRYSGRIWVESEPGKGSVFYFTLPA